MRGYESSLNKKPPSPHVQNIPPHTKLYYTRGELLLGGRGRAELAGDHYKVPDPAACFQRGHRVMRGFPKSRDPPWGLGLGP